MMVNSFSLKSDDLISSQSIGTGLYLAGSYLDHSCQPNAKAVFNGNKVNIVAIRDFETSPDLNNVRTCVIIY